MTTIATTAGSVKDLNSAITAPKPHHRSLKLVNHDDDDSFVVVSLPESMGDAANCERRKPDGDPDFAGDRATGYGKYYASGLIPSTGSVEPGTLWVVWSKVNGSWMIVSYVIQTP
ncbi:MAG TPA: hypothetical protein VEX68_24945 [Bryobacteraceae bacterium]|nr:hypothetical protein [Bryobacteraceae bacterium]